MQIDSQLLQQLISLNKQQLDNNTLLQLLKTGDEIKGKIQMLENNKIVLKLLNGQILNAKLDTPMGLPLGKTIPFLVKTNQDGQLVLTPKTPAPKPTGVENQALSNAGLGPTKENIELIKTLMGEKLPIDKANVMNFKQFMTKEGITPERLRLMLKNDLPIQSDVATKLNQLLDNKNGMTSSLHHLKTGLLTHIEEPVVREVVEQLIEEPVELHKETEMKTVTQNLQKSLDKVLTLDVREDNAIKNTKAFYEHLSKKLEVINKSLEGGNTNRTESLGSLKESTEQVKGHLQLLNHFNEHLDILHLPLQFSNGIQGGNLYVFDEKSERGNGDGQQFKTAVLALDMPYLGDMEAFLVLSGKKQLWCDIKMSSEGVINLARNKASQLQQKLLKLGYHIESLKFNLLEEPFDVTQIENNQLDQGSQYSFDMKV